MRRFLGSGSLVVAAAVAVLATLGLAACGGSAAKTGTSASGASPTTTVVSASASSSASSSGGSTVCVSNGMSVGPIDGKASTLDKLPKNWMSLTDAQLKALGFKVTYRQGAPDCHPADPNYKAFTPPSTTKP